MRARATIYRGTRMRSRLEASFAAFLDNGGLHWQYEGDAFADATGQYLPDFVLTDQSGRRLYVEVKPTEDQALAALPGMQVIRSSDPSASFRAVWPISPYANGGHAVWGGLPADAPGFPPHSLQATLDALSYASAQQPRSATGLRATGRPPAPPRSIDGRVFQAIGGLLVLIVAVVALAILIPKAVHDARHPLDFFGITTTTTVPTSPEVNLPKMCIFPGHGWTVGISWPVYDQANPFRVMPQGVSYLAVLTVGTLPPQAGRWAGPQDVHPALTGLPPGMTVTLQLTEILPSGETLAPRTSTATTPATPC